MKVTPPWATRPVKLFIGYLTLLWVLLIAGHLLGFRFIRPNLEKAEDRATYGQPYTHK
ncbi:MAG: hypothetical protein JNL52_01080 [Flavobacteriales bacterium]|nr:hypothetical protein [Flavobacteriales bacterium]